NPLEHSDLIRCISTIDIKHSSTFWRKVAHFKAELIRFKLLCYAEPNAIVNPTIFELSNFFSRSVGFARYYFKPMLTAFALAVSITLIFAFIPATAPLLALWGTAAFALVSAAPVLAVTLSSIIASCVFAQKSLVTNINNKNNQREPFSPSKVNRGNRRTPADANKPNIVVRRVAVVKGRTDNSDIANSKRVVAKR
ncbi:MAG TPA: hypothetical protein VD770_03865, partial [Coxiellaceae bacterium]|nr:hypothetical protein [Coxiellaceae bacterium]